MVLTCSLHLEVVTGWQSHMPEWLELNAFVTYVDRECSSCKWRKAYWTMRSIVHRRRPCCLPPMQYRQNTEITVPLRLRKDTWLMTVCCLQGTDYYLHLLLDKLVLATCWKCWAEGCAENNIHTGMHSQRVPF